MKVIIYNTINRLQAGSELLQFYRVAVDVVTCQRKGINGKFTGLQNLKVNYSGGFCTI